MEEGRNTSVEYIVRIFGADSAVISRLREMFGENRLKVRGKNPKNMIYSLRVLSKEDADHISILFKTGAGFNEFDVFISVYPYNASEIMEMPSYVVDIMKLPGCRSFISYTNLQ